MLRYSMYGGEGGTPYVLSEAKRKELLDMGFPDDGYDYSMHMKDLGPHHQQQQPKRKPKAPRKPRPAGEGEVSSRSEH